MLSCFMSILLLARDSSTVVIPNSSLLMTMDCAVILNNIDDLGRFLSS